MFEKILPLIIVLIALQLLMKYKNSKKKDNPAPSRNFDYKQRINEFLKISDYDLKVKNEKQFADEIRLKMVKPDMQVDIPDSMQDVRRNLNLIIDGVTHAVKVKTGSVSIDEKKYNSPEKMFDEILEVVLRHKI